MTIAKKKLVAVCLALLFSMAGLAPAVAMTAQTDNNDMAVIDPFFQNIASISVGLTINNGRASMSGSVSGHVGVQYITVDAVLVRHNANGTTTHIGTWQTSNNGRTWAWTHAHQVTRGFNYTLTLTATITRNGVDETVTVSRTTWAG
jgi:hypothetical protein